MLHERKHWTNAEHTTQKICQAFGETYVSTRSTQKLFKKFASSDESLKDPYEHGGNMSLMMRNYRLESKNIPLKRVKC